MSKESITATIDLTEREREQAGVYGECLRSMQRGHPRPFVENFLQIMDGESRQLVPFHYVETQEILDESVFAPLKRVTDPVRENILKARQVRMSSLAFGVTFGVGVNIKNTDALYAFQDEKTGEAAEQRLENFEDGLPKWFWWERQTPSGMEKVTIEEKGKRSRKYGFWKKEGGTWVRDGVSTITIVSAGSRSFGAGPKYNVVVFDEYDEYEDLRLVNEVMAAVAANSGWVFKITNPRGMKHMYADYMAVKEGRGIGHNTVFYCFMNRSNQIPEGSRAAAPRYGGAFTLTGEHQAVMASGEWQEWSLFKDDPTVFFRWYETEMQRIRQSLEAEGIRDEKRVRGEFYGQHMTDDVHCWSTFGKTPFSQEVIADYHQRGIANAPKRDEYVAPDFRLRVWVPPQPGMVYSCSMDSSLGRAASDAISASIKDATGHYVATLYGRVDLGIATREVVKVLKSYATVMEPLFAPEIDGKLGLFVIEEAKRNGYSNFWYMPDKPGDDIDKFSLKPKQYGWRTQGNKEDMMQRGVARFNNRDCLTWDVDLLRDMSTFDPAVETHTSDRLMDFFINESITDADHPKGYGRQWAGMCAQVRGLWPEYGNRRDNRAPRRGYAEPVGSGVWGVN